MKKRSTTPVLTSGLGEPECLRWHDGALWFSDMAHGTVHRWTLEGGSDVVAEIPGRAAGLGWLPDGRLLAVSMDGHKVYRREFDGTLVVHADLGEDAGGPANDMLVDEQGRAYVGNFGFDYHSFVRQRPNSALYSPPGPPRTRIVCFAPDGSRLGVSEPLSFPNGCVLTADGIFIVAETLGFKLTALRRDEQGVLVDGRTWAPLVPENLWTLLNHPGMAGRMTRRISALLDRPVIAERSTSPIAPDGIALASDGHTVWVANALRSECVRVGEGGRVLDRVRTTQHTLSCVVGGPKRDILFAATAPSDDPDVAGRLDRGRIEMARLDGN
ncbi:SMP-30/gluconolactonase/LRE family protein [Actinospica durhamensis]|uniref:SMP-30/gluconolactonase/LRE family protein n=1 Tax=Actinospica durhamensis TaxID=1508375 RepID=A0A941ET38_9ACTN|nr:SMP-30/gluconolactonase/LRE family protein [Actinospica durhamensis]MBR7836541.1 SMP-30/gluconolactonase/LRE family protein [Actinospica durhamensis]